MKLPILQHIALHACDMRFSSAGKLITQNKLSKNNYWLKNNTKQENNQMNKQEYRYDNNV